MSKHTPRRSAAGRVARPSRKAARITGLAVVAGGLVASAGLVWQASYSAFSATTTTPTNNWTAGTVAITNDATGSALFTVTNMKPGDSGSKCVVVTSNGSLASTVKLYTTSGSLSTSTAARDVAFGNGLQLTVTQGSIANPAGGGSCTNFVADSGATNAYSGSLANFGSTYTGFTGGFGTWAPAAGTGVKKVYQISYSLPQQTGTNGQANTDAMQGGTASIGFTWEEQNS